MGSDFLAVDILHLYDSSWILSFFELMNRHETREEWVVHNNQSIITWLQVTYQSTKAPLYFEMSLAIMWWLIGWGGLDFKKLDVKTSFLKADLEEEVYFSISQGVAEDCKAKCLNLKRAIYGLKQEPLAWLNWLSSWLIKVGFKLTVADLCVFYLLDENPVWLFVQVDDISVFRTNLN